MRPPPSDRRGHARFEVMMTPMIDIVFQLIIFFMLMPAFEMNERYLPTNLPQWGPGPPPRIEPLRGLRIDLLHPEPWSQHEGEALIRLNGEQVRDNADLRSRLRQARRDLNCAGADLGRMPVLISPDMVVWHKHVVAAFDAAIDAGFTDIQFAVPK